MIQLKKGDTWPFTVTAASNGSPVDLTGYTIYFTMRDNPEVGEDDDSDAAISKTILPADISDPTNGIAEFVIPSSITKDVEVGKYYAEIELKTPGGAIQSTQLLRVEVLYDLTNLSK